MLDWVPGRIDENARDCSSINCSNGVNEGCGVALAVEGEVVACVQHSCRLLGDCWVCEEERCRDGGVLGAVFELVTVFELERAFVRCQESVHSVADFCWDVEER